MLLDRLHARAVVGAHVLAVVYVEVAALRRLVVSGHKQLVFAGIHVDERNFLIVPEVQGSLVLTWQSLFLHVWQEHVDAVAQRCLKTVLKKAR